jgi:signal transduction histidine kinase
MEMMTRATGDRNATPCGSGFAGEPAESGRRLSALQDALARAGQLAIADQMVAEIAHQIGTPLNLISGYVQMMREQDLERATVRTWLGIIETQIARIATALRSIQEQVRQPLLRELTNPRTLVERACDVLRPKLDGMRVALDVHVPAALPDVKADPTLMELALVHLLVQCLEGVEAGGRLTLTLSSGDSRVRLEVVGSRGGTSRAAAVDLSGATKSAGLDPGLGLSIAKNVVEAHGGTIEVRRESGCPAVFTIDLPAAPPEPPSA